MPDLGEIFLKKHAKEIQLYKAHDIRDRTTAEVFFGMADGENLHKGYATLCSLIDTEFLKGSKGDGEYVVKAAEVAKQLEAIYLRNTSPEMLKEIGDYLQQFKTRAPTPSEVEVIKSIRWSLIQADPGSRDAPLEKCRIAKSLAKSYKDSEYEEMYRRGMIGFEEMQSAKSWQNMVEDSQVNPTLRRKTDEDGTYTVAIGKSSLPMMKDELESKCSVCGNDGKHLLFQCRDN